MGTGNSGEIKRKIEEFAKTCKKQSKAKNSLKNIATWL